MNNDFWFNKRFIFVNACKGQRVLPFLGARVEAGLVSNYVKTTDFENQFSQPPPSSRFRTRTTHSTKNMVGNLLRNQRAIYFNVLHRIYYKIIKQLPSISSIPDKTETQIHLTTTSGHFALSCHFKRLLQTSGLKINWMKNRTIIGLRSVQEKLMADGTRINTQRG